MKFYNTFCHVERVILSVAEGRDATIINQSQLQPISTALDLTKHPVRSSAVETQLQLNIQHTPNRLGYQYLQSQKYDLLRKEMRFLL